MVERFSSAIVRARRLTAAEHGFAVPTVLFMLLAALLIVTVAIAASIRTQHGTIRDQDSKAALQAAQAGVNQAALRYNTYYTASSPLTSALPCISASGQRTATSGGWCAGVPVTTSDGTATYYVRPVWTTNSQGLPIPSQIEVVSVGTVSGVTRRIDVTARSVSGSNIFSNASVLAQNDITLDQNSRVTAGVQSGGDITVASQARQCGHATVGIGRLLKLTGSGSYYSDQGCQTAADPNTAGHDSLILPPVNEGDAATNNDDIRITNAVLGSGTPADLISGNRGDVNWNGSGGSCVPNGFESGPKRLFICNNSALTLTGTKYSFCQVVLESNAAIYVAANLNVTIFFDSPESCGLTPGAGGTVDQLRLSSNSRITATEGAPSSIALLFVGSTSIPTSVQMNSNTQLPGQCVQNFVVYAPLSDVTLNSNSQYCGSIAGQTVHLNQNSVAQTDNMSDDFTLPNTPPHYSTEKFVECSAAPASPPNSGC